MSTWVPLTSMAALGWLGASLFLLFVASRVAALATPDSARLLELVRRKRVHAGLSPMSFRR